MPTLNELKRDALAQLTGLDGTVNEMEWAWLGGTPGDTLNGLWLAYLAAQGFDTGIRNQDEWAYYESLGYLGTLNEKRYQFWGVLATDSPPPDVAGNLLQDYNSLNNVPPWDDALGDIQQQYLGDGWWRLTNLSPDTTKSFAQFHIPALLSVGDQYRIQAEFRNKNALGTDYRLAIAEYDGSTWRGASTTDLDILVAGDPTPVLMTADRATADATSDRIRFAVQMVNPPAAGMSIELRLPAMLFLGGGGGQQAVPDMVLTAGSMGQNRGYIRGSIGSVTPDMTSGGDEIRELKVRANNGNVTFKVEGNYPQNAFEFLEIDFQPRLFSAAADSFSQAGGETEWIWNGTSIVLNDTQVYEVEFN